MKPAVCQVVDSLPAMKDLLTVDWKSLGPSGVGQAVMDAWEVCVGIYCYLTVGPKKRHHGVQSAAC